MEGVGGAPTENLTTRVCSSESLLALAWQFVGVCPSPGDVSTAAYPTGVTAKQAVEGFFVR